MNQEVTNGAHLLDHPRGDGIAGIEHFYAAPDIEVKLVALANVVAEALQGKGESRKKQNLKKM